MSSCPASTPVHPTVRHSNTTTFTRDLEFLSSLSNPYYLHTLASQQRLSDPCLLLYLRHLNYFRHPRYVRYLQYPQALHMLDLLQHKQFREALKDQAWANEIANRQARHWATWRDPTGDADQADEAQSRDTVQSDFKPPPPPQQSS